MPHASGIASSASGLSALALCLCSLDPEQAASPTAFFTRASHLARLGSGSASRSVFPGFSLWGESPEVAGSSDLHAVPLGQVDASLSALGDSILIVSREPKVISSSQGHALMDAHPLAPYRYRSARERLPPCCERYARETGRALRRSSRRTRSRSTGS